MVHEVANVRELIKELFPIVFSVMFISVFVWFGLCVRLFRLLETRHPDKYNAMGRPSLIMNNSISNNILFMKFLFKREYSELNDPSVSRLGQLMRAFFFVFLVVFMFMFLGMLLLRLP